MSRDRHRRPFRRRGRWAGDVEFVGGDAFSLVEPLNDCDVLADGVAEDVDDDIAERISEQRRELAGDEVVDADVLESDGVEHAGGGLNDARSGMAGHGLERDSLGDEAADGF